MLSELFHVDADLAPGAELEVPQGHAGRAAYVVDGSFSCDGEVFGAGTMIVFREGVAARVAAAGPARAMLLGGAPLDGERHIWWNFVSSSRERIERDGAPAAGARGSGRPTPSRSRPRPGGVSPAAGSP